MMIRLILITACLTAGSAHAASEAMRALAFLEGDWDARYYEYDMSGAEVFVGENAARYDVTLGGQLIEETMTILGTQTDFPMRTFTSWDAEKQVYRMAAVDQPGGMMDLYEGQLIDGVLTMTNLEHETFYKTPDGDPMAFRLTWRFPADDEDRFVLGSEISTDRGASWRALSRIEYKRQG